jgi:two-component system chemotaxis response regulator CheB
MRHSLARLLAEGGLDVVGTAGNGEEGLARVRELRPDVVTLDVEMPVLGGLDMLRRLMVEAPTRVVMLSSLTTNGAAVTLDALDAGAIDFVAKPGGSLTIDIGRVGEELVAKVRAAAGMSDGAFQLHRRRHARPLAATAASTASPASPALPAVRQRPTTTATSVPGRSGVAVACRKLVVIASSTGGPGALDAVVRRLPADLGAGVVIVQHMPPGFTASLAGRLDDAGPLPCHEAAGGDLIVDDAIAVAPGDHHLISSLGGRVQLVSLPPVHGVRPAADVTLQAVAPAWRERLLCVVLTGMGVDARDGARAVKQHGGTVFAQDEASATVWGMPGAVVGGGLADRVVALDRIGEAIARWARETPGAGRTTPH